jgi:hypothetical protein
MGMHVLSPEAVKKEIIECMKVNIAAYLVGNPGIGKSECVYQIGEEYHLEVIDLRMSQMAPEDLMGLPMRKDNKAFFAPFDIFPLEDTPLPPGKKGWILFLDELPAASKAVLAASYKIILDKMVGGYKLHPNVFIVAAGNKTTDNAIAKNMGTAMQSRICTLEIGVSMEDSLKHFHKIGMDNRIIGFIEFQPSKLHSFDPKHTDATFACPRTWEFASKFIKGKEFNQISLPLLAGVLSDGIAEEFYTFLQEYEQLPKFSQIEQSPETTFIPPEGSTKYALVTMLVDYSDEKTIDFIAKYVKRLPADFQVIYFRNVVRKDPQLKQHQAFQENMLDLTRLIYDDDDTSAAA